MNLEGVVEQVPSPPKGERDRVRGVNKERIREASKRIVNFCATL